MRYHTITLHLTKSQTSVTASAFCRLSRQNLGWATASRVNLVLNHVLQSLIVGRSQENHDFHLFTTETVVHYLITSKLIAQAVQLLRNSLNGVTVA